MNVRACLFVGLMVLAFLGANGFALAQTAASDQKLPELTKFKSETEFDFNQRKKLAEQIQKFHAEREALNAESDKLTVECMDAKGKEKSACVDKKKALQARVADMHKRMKESRKAMVLERADQRRKVREMRDVRRNAYFEKLEKKKISGNASVSKPDAELSGVTVP